MPSKALALALTKKSKMSKKAASKSHGKTHRFWFGRRKKNLAGKTNPHYEPFSEQQKSYLRDIFEEVYTTNKWKLFWINFFRGIFLGFGTVVGGTILVAILIWVLSQSVDWFPAISDFTQRLIDSLSTGKP